MKRIATMIAVLVVTTLSLVWSPAAAAQALTSGPQQITLNVALAESLLLICTPSTVNFTAGKGHFQCHTLIFSSDSHAGAPVPYTQPRAAAVHKYC